MQKSRALRKLIGEATSEKPVLFRVLEKQMEYCEALHAKIDALEERIKKVDGAQRKQEVCEERERQRKRIFPAWERGDKALTPSRFRKSHSRMNF